MCSQLDGNEVVTTYGPDDCFDGRGLVAGKVSSRFVAAEEVVAYQLAKQAVSELIAANATFGALLFSDLSNKLSALSDAQSQHEMQSLTMARVDEAFMRPAQYVDADTDILSVVQACFRRSARPRAGARRSQQPPRLGIFTTTGAAARHPARRRPLDQLAVGELATFKLVDVRPADQLCDALATMLRHQVRRVVVAGRPTRPKILGMLDAAGPVQLPVQPVAPDHAPDPGGQGPGRR